MNVHIRDSVVEMLEECGHEIYARPIENFERIITTYHNFRYHYVGLEADGVFLIITRGTANPSNTKINYADPDFTEKLRKALR